VEEAKARPVTSKLKEKLEGYQAPKSIRLPIPGIYLGLLHGGWMKNCGGKATSSKTPSIFTFRWNRLKEKSCTAELLYQRTHEHSRSDGLFAMTNAIGM